MLYGIRRGSSAARGGLLIAVLAPMSPLWLDKATAAEIDMMQVMWVTGSILCLLRALEGVEDGRRGVHGDTGAAGPAVSVGRWTLDGASVSGAWSMLDGKKQDAPTTMQGSPSTLAPPTTDHRPPSTFLWWLLRCSASPGAC